MNVAKADKRLELSQGKDASQIPVTVVFFCIFDFFASDRPEKVKVEDGSVMVEVAEELGSEAIDRFFHGADVVSGILWVHGQTMSRGMRTRVEEVRRCEEGGNTKDNGSSCEVLALASFHLRFLFDEAADLSLRPLEW